MHMAFKCTLAVQLHTKEVVVGTSMNGKPQTRPSHMGRVDSPVRATNQSLGFVRIQYHAPVIAVLLNLAMSLLRKAATAGPSRQLYAVLQTSASSSE